MKITQKATIIAMTTAAGLAVIKCIVGIMSGSIAVLSSAIDSLLDMGVSFFNAIALRNSSKTPDEKFNYGRGKIEAIAAFVEGVIIACSAIFILYESTQKFIHQKPIDSVSIGIFVMIASVVVTGILVTFLQNIAQKTNNLVIRADALHYKTDLWTNIGILVSLVVVYYTQWFWIDAILGIIIAMYIGYSAFEIIRQGFLLLLDIALDASEVEKIQKILRSHLELNDFHELRTRSSGGTKFVEAHLVFHQDILLIDAHRVSHEIEDEICALDPHSVWSVVFHLDPYNDEIEDQQKKLKK